MPPQTTPFTTLDKANPCNAFATCLAADSRSLATAFTLAEAIWEAVMTLGRDRSGLSKGIGSGSQTSNAAADNRPLVNALTNAAVSMRSPRAKLMTIAPGFTFAKVSSRKSFFVAVLLGKCN